jgi:hypothetical protein
MWKTSTLKIQELCLLGSDAKYLEEFYKRFSEKSAKVFSEEINFFSEDRNSVDFCQTTRCFNPNACRKISDRFENLEFHTI